MKKELETEVDKIYRIEFNVMEEEGYINIYDEFDMPLLLENVYDIKTTKSITILATTDKIKISSENDFQFSRATKLKTEFIEQKQLYITEKYNFIREEFYPKKYLDLYNDTEEIIVLGIPAKEVLEELNKYNNVSIYLDEEDCYETIDEYDNINFYSYNTDERFEQREFNLEIKLTPENNQNIIPYFFSLENKEITNKYISHIDISLPFPIIPPVNIILQNNLKKKNYLIKYLEEFNVLWEDNITFNDLTICSILDCNINGLRFDKTKVFFYCTDNTKEYARNFVDKYKKFDYCKVSDFKEIKEYNCPKMIFILTDEWEDKYEKLNFIECPTFIFYLNFYEEDVISKFDKIKKKNLYTDPFNESYTKRFNISDFIKKETKTEYNTLIFENYDNEGFINKHPECDFAEIKELMHKVNTVFLGDTAHKYYLLLYSFINNTTIFFRNNFNYTKYINKYLNYSNISPIILKKIKFAAQKDINTFNENKNEQCNLAEDINNYFMKTTFERVDKFNENSNSIKYIKKSEYNKDELIEEQWICLYDTEVFIKDFKFENTLFKKYIFTDTIHIEENKLFHKKNNKKMKEKNIFEVVAEENRDNEIKASIKELKKICDNPTLAEPLMQDDIKTIKQKVKIKTLFEVMENVIYHICMHGQKYFVIREYLNYLEKYLFEKKILFKKDIGQWQNLTQRILYNKNKNLIKQKKPCLYLSIYYNKISFDKIKSLFKLCYYPIFRYTYDYELLEKIDNSIEDIFNPRLLCFDFTKVPKLDFTQLSKFVKLCSYMENKTGCVSHIITNHEKIENLQNIYSNVYDEMPEDNYSKIISFDKNNVMALKKLSDIEVNIIKDELDKILNIDKYKIHDKNRIEGFRVQELLNKGDIIAENPEEYIINVKNNVLKNVEKVLEKKNNKELIKVFLEIIYTKLEKIEVKVEEIIDFETRENDNNMISI